MQREDLHLRQLQVKIRRSSSFQHEDTFRDYMTYAKLCQDELDVLNFMEENKIGTKEAEFWLYKLEVLRQRCQFKEIARILNNVKRDPTFNQQLFHLTRRANAMCPFLDFQFSVRYQMFHYIQLRNGKRKRARRSMEEFQLFSISKIEKSHRKIGKMNVYVDEDCRSHYELEDYANFFDKHLKDECEQMAKPYFQKQKQKPLSFVGVERHKLQKVSLELIGQGILQGAYNQCSQPSQNTEKSQGTASDDYFMNTPIKSIIKPRKSVNQFGRKSENLLDVYCSIKKTPKNQQQSKQFNPQSAYVTPKSKNNSSLYNSCNERYRKEPKSRRQNSNAETELLQLDAFDDVSINNAGISQRNSDIQSFRYLQSNELNEALLVETDFKDETRNKNYRLQNQSSNFLDCSELEDSLKKSLHGLQSVQQDPESTSGEEVACTQLTKSKTLQSVVDSNQQNLCESNSQLFQQQRLLQKNRRSKFEVLKQEDLSSIRGPIDSSEQSHYQRFIFNKTEDDESLREFVFQLQDAISKENRVSFGIKNGFNGAIPLIEPSRVTQEINESQNNIVLETLRKKRNSILVQKFGLDLDSSVIYLTNSERQNRQKNSSENIKEQKSYSNYKLSDQRRFSGFDPKFLEKQPQDSCSDFQNCTNKEKTKYEKI